MSDKRRTLVRPITHRLVLNIDTLFVRDDFLYRDPTGGIAGSAARAGRPAGRLSPAAGKGDETRVKRVAAMRARGKEKARVVPAAAATAVAVAEAAAEAAAAAF